MEKMLLKCQTSVTDVSTSSMESMEVEYGSSYLKQLQLRFSREYVALYFRIAESARLQVRTTCFVKLLLIHLLLCHGLITTMIYLLFSG